ncbi:MULTISPECIES: SDR family NAD(P)-dependent oxidoreductase [unclassified Mesorhizobium]|uniref:SDR family oxidoreductase n=1 Tax=unclassified Mesorhizobium TaxID=325217 RepID=UPI000FC9F3BF|nr:MULTISPECIES: SDR family NAD(P)-dependent oxidoreductase [unclassified Mesorhizobium]TGP18204.1 SDR family oxidoreductase [Mesorhizobium sp. M1D.F.Ca.ET.231.01.1.1]TGP25442.1 SDR family oxidoreductase [Mesorhizobium sp. M1D.F.Ca.ET.234.01.1.1]TGS38328.1 SDR family oxidoreductase [Mesorhizobium sp. M1D.F.Ca.ET.184.01.1.1]TGS58335.1 SDR family oxidoreductase [Mesorhizobium sp. M1D.F.Ca.ET.183.01.1.1]
MRGLKDRVVLVTGAAQGIGKATAKRLADEEMVVAVADRNFAGAEAVAGEISAATGQALALFLDVTSRVSWTECVARVVDTFGGLDGLVNNAGMTRDSSLLKMKDDDWNDVIDVNLRGPWLGCQIAIPHMTAKGGSIVNLSSEARWGAFGQSNYSSAKSGLVGLTRTVAFEHARHRVRVNAVAPGTITTAMVEAVPADVRKGWLQNIPLRREGDPSEIASVVAFLLSDDASYVTGQIIGVNGGSII